MSKGHHEKHGRNGDGSRVHVGAGIRRRIVHTWRPLVASWDRTGDGDRERLNARARRADLLEHLAAFACYLAIPVLLGGVFFWPWTIPSLIALVGTVWVMFNVSRRAL